jgi:hypothetical protein
MIKKQDTNKMYHSQKGISASGLKKIYKKSVYHYLHQQPFDIVINGIWFSDTLRNTRAENIF